MKLMCENYSSECDYISADIKTLFRSISIGQNHRIILNFLLKNHYMIEKLLEG